MFFSASYTGNRGNHLLHAMNPINDSLRRFLRSTVRCWGSRLIRRWPLQPESKSLGSSFLTTAATTTVLQALRPYPQFGTITNNFDMTGSALQRAMQLQVEKRLYQRPELPGFLQLVENDVEHQLRV